jgi:very-short-patch-repair endonuclease
MGVTADYERGKVERGEWDRPSPRVVREVVAPRTPEQALMIAVIEAGPTAVASHQSAAWLWGLLPGPDRHALTVPPPTSHKVQGVIVHRLSDRPRLSYRSGIPCTNPLRTLVDLAAVCLGDQLDEAVDRAIARRLITVDGIVAELDRLGRHGRRGAGAMRAALKRRGMISAPNPSVLESRVIRLLRQGGIEPLGLEVKVCPDGRYRVDALLAPSVAVEVDGHAYHSTPEQKSDDERRRAEIRLSGIFLLVYDWMAVTKDGRRVLSECHRALVQHGGLHS